MPESKLLLPKFLTKGIAEFAMITAARALRQPDWAIHVLKHPTFHIVILVPAMQMGGEYPNYPLQPHMLAELNFGESKSSWKYPYDEIAQCKALQLWHGRNDGGTDIQPHLLFSGDTPFWGGVKRNGIVVACSGVKPFFDRMIASVTADICVALAYDAWERSPDKADGELCFLT